MSYYQCPHCKNDAKKNNVFVNISYEFNTRKKCEHCQGKVKYNWLNYFVISIILKPAIFLIIAMGVCYFSYELLEMLDASENTISMLLVVVYFLVLVPVAIVYVYSFSLISDYLIWKLLKLKLYVKR